MKKLFYMLGLVLLAASCSDEYEPWASPQTNPQENAITITGLNAVATATQDLATAGDEVQIFTLTDANLPEGYALSNARVVVSPADGSGAETTINTTVEGLAGNADLQALAVNAYGRRPVERTFNAHVYLNAVKDGTAVLIDAGQIQVVLIPAAPKISQNYYIVGGTLGWDTSAASKEQKFNHSDADVYEDPVFTIMMKVNSGETWFAIGDDEACDAIANENNYSKLLGQTAGNGENGLTGYLAPRTELSDDGSFKYVGEGGYILVTINMMDYTFTLAPVSSQFYIFGDFAGWNGDGAAKNLMFPQGGNVFTYTAQFNGNVKIWGAGDFNNWGACYNTSKANDGTTAMSGTIEQSDGGAIHSPEDGLFTFTLDLDNMTYKWEKLANQSPATYANISLIGNFNGWGGDVELTEVNPHNWYTEFTQTDTGNCQLKLRANHDWGTNWGFGNDGDWAVSNADWAKVCSNGAGNIYVPAGTYDIYLNDITGEVRIVKK